MIIQPTHAEWFAYAQQVLAAHKMNDAELEWLSQTHNAVFKVRHKEHSYVLRLSHKPKALTALHGELAWLWWIKHSTDVVIPVSIALPTQFNSLSTQEKSIHKAMLHAVRSVVVSPIDQDEVYGVLFEHLTGGTLTLQNVLPLHITAIGHSLATLHQLHLAIPSFSFSEQMQVWDAVGLLDEKSPYNITSVQHLFTADQLELLQTLQQRFDILMAEIGTNPADWGMIHGDFLLKNVLWDGDTVRFLDFEYCGMGYYLYDVATLLWELKLQPHYAALKEALLDGYTRVRPLGQQEHLEALIALRHMLSMHWIALNHDHPYVAGRAAVILAQRAQELRAYLATGELKRQP